MMPTAALLDVRSLRAPLLLVNTADGQDVSGSSTDTDRQPVLLEFTR